MGNLLVSVIQLLEQTEMPLGSVLVLTVSAAERRIS